MLADKSVKSWDDCLRLKKKLKVEALETITFVLQMSCVYFMVKHFISIYLTVIWLLA